MGGVSRDRSLDEFARGEPSAADDAPAAEDDTPDAEADDNAPEATADAEVEPAVSTYAFSPDGAACDACGAVVQKRWRDESGLVCPDCKAW